jgi:hypothetical protein
MKNFLLFLVLSSFSYFGYSQNSNYLLGKIYTKSTDVSSSTDLNFNNKSTGIMSGVSLINGRRYDVSTGFSYKIIGNKLEIIYEDGLGTENYIIDKASDQLKSTHLEGYVDGKWGKVYYKRK